MGKRGHSEAEMCALRMRRMMERRDFFDMWHRIRPCRAANRAAVR
jgi:hypothetical protein